MHSNVNRTDLATTDPASMHVPVMLERCTELLLPALVGDEAAQGPAVHVDGTLGMGGHAQAILERAPQAVVIGIDRDPDALELAERRLARFGDRFRPVHAVYDEIADVIEDEGFDAVSSVLLDLGVSSLQIDEADRGFAYRADAPLDMRMDQSAGRTAADLLNNAEVGQLTAILRDYGEERFAHKIARRIVAEREREPFERSARLVQLLTDVIPAASQRSGGHPAKRTFQALRIAVNGELDSLARAVPLSLQVLALRGRVAVLSYHSLEDRMVKRVFTASATSSAPLDLPVVPAEHTPTHRLLTRGAEDPTPEQIEQNPRAASARLRAAMRIRTGERPGVVTDAAATGHSHSSPSHSQNTRQRRSKGRSR